MILRSLLLILVCLNVGTTVWWIFHTPATSIQVPPLPAGVAGLTMLAQIEPSSSNDSAELNAAPEPLANMSLCLSVGPFDTPSALRKATDILTPQVGRIQYREAQVEAIRGYRVYLPAAASREQALQRARDLASKGIRDYYVVTAGPAENTVALGMFREEANATRRRDQIAALGVDVKMEASSDERPQWWLEIAVNEGFDWKTALGSAAATLQSKNIPCS